MFNQCVAVLSEGQMFDQLLLKGRIKKKKKIDKKLKLGWSRLSRDNSRFIFTLICILVLQVWSWFTPWLLLGLLVLLGLL